MPKVKQPASLRNMAMDRLINFCTSLCVTLSGQGDLERLRHVVLFVKSYAAPLIPPQLNAEFHNRILKLLWSSNSELKKHPLSHQEIVFEMILDKKIVGLECDFDDLPLRPDNAHRIRGLMRLTAQDEKFVQMLPKFHLEDLRYLKILGCRDEHLKFIAEKCPKLEHLNIEHGDTITDVGLRSLVPCTNLRFVRATSDLLSLHAVDQFLSASGKKREMDVTSYMQGFDDSQASTYQFIESLGMQDCMDPISNRHLQTIVERFPNLREFQLQAFTLDSDLATLSDLDKLSCLYIHCTYVAWKNLETLLRSIGGNLRTLQLTAFSIDQNEIDSLFELCANVEYLSVETNSDRFTQNKVVVPEFKNLISLGWRNNGEYHGTLEFGAMLKLEELMVLGFDIQRGIEPIILDNENFPNLKKITIRTNKYDYYHNEIKNEIKRLKRIVRINNLDLEIC